jgi:hypothetical protein
MKSFIFAFLMAFSLGGNQAHAGEAPVKKSTTGICHTSGSTYYAQTKSFTPFKTLDECLKSGGRLPKR